MHGPNAVLVTAVLSRTDFHPLRTRTREKEVLPLIISSEEASSIRRICPENWCESNF